MIAIIRQDPALAILYACIVAFAYWVFFTPSLYERSQIEERARNVRKYQACEQAFGTYGVERVYRECGHLIP